MFKRIYSLVVSYLSRVVSLFESRDPLVLIETEKSKLRNDIVRFNKRLSEQASFIFNAATKLRALSSQIEELKQKIYLSLQTGDKGRAAKYALELRKLEGQLQEMNTRYTVAEEAYQALEKVRDKTILDATNRIKYQKSLISQTDNINSHNELITLIKEIHENSGVSSEQFIKTDEIIETSHQTAMGKARLLNNDLQKEIQNIEVQEQETHILEIRALDEFLIKHAVHEQNRSVINLPVRVYKEHKGANYGTHR